MRRRRDHVWQAVYLGRYIALTSQGLAVPGFQRLLFKDLAGLNGGITALLSNKKYLFSQHNKRPLDMAGTYYPTATEVAERVTLTTSTNEKCAACRCLSNSSSSLQLQCQRR
jgi:hypothetical protein